MAASRPYRLTLKETLDRTVVADDSVSTRLEIPDILPPQQTAEVLSRHLRGRGFTEDGGGNLTRSQGRITVDVDPNTREVTVTGRAEEGIHLEDEADSPQGGCGCVERNKERIKEGLRERLRKMADDQEKDLQRQVTAELEEAVAKVGCELERVAAQTTATALKRRAQEIGRIKSIQQDEKSGVVTIVVEVPT